MAVENTETKKKKRILPGPGKPESLQKSLEAIHKQYGKALEKLAK
jgi:hypothetical protein